MAGYVDPFMDNYYAFLLALIYPYALTADEALEAIKDGVTPLKITKQTLSDAFELSKKKKIPKYFYEYSGRRYEVVLLLADIIKETNNAMQHLRDYELGKYRTEVLEFMNQLRERMVKDKIR